MPTDETEMTPAETVEHDEELEAQLVHSRAHLLPEEEVAGKSADPEAQAQIILEDSERRTEDPDGAPTTFVEHRTSEQTL